MDKRYEIFNEVRFEAYAKTAIDNAILKEYLRKKARRKQELSLSMLTDSILYTIAEQDINIELEDPLRVFDTHGRSVLIYDRRLAQAIADLLPTERDIILLYYFSGWTDERIARSMGMTRPTVSRRRKAAREMLRSILEDTK